MAACPAVISHVKAAIIAGQRLGYTADDMCGVFCLAVSSLGSGNSGHPFDREKINAVAAKMHGLVRHEFPACSANSVDLDL